MATLHSAAITGSGLWHPANVITNNELVDAYNQHAEHFNAQHADAIAAGDMTAKPLSNAEFIEKASGIKQRYVMDKAGILDINRLCPSLPERGEDELSYQAEMACHAAREAMASANKQASDIDAVIVSCAYTERAYPAIAIEVQGELGIEGFGFDMLVACSAATFALHRAYEMVAAGTARAVLVINPELTSPQLNYGDRDSHFIFGDVATALIVERADEATSDHIFDILSTKAQTVFSNNIRSDFGYLSRATGSDPYRADKLFHQNGRKVFKEVCPMAAQHLSDHVAANGETPQGVRRWWLHQANINMNQLIVRKLLDKEPGGEEAPIVLDEFANTASAGSIIAFHRHHRDLIAGDMGVICSFGAGYSIGSLVIRKR